MAAELNDAIAKVVSASRKAGKKCGIYSTGGEQAKLFVDQGFDMISVGTDWMALEATMKDQLALATGAVKPSKGGSY